MTNYLKLINLQGFARGGTNILWNILQSHESIVSPIVELNEIFGSRSTEPPIARNLYKSAKILGVPIIGSHLQNRADQKLEDFKIKTLEHTDNKFKDEHTLYSKVEIHKSSLVTKGVNDWVHSDYKFTSLLNRLNANTYNIFVIREGISLAEGLKRRGLALDIAVDLYNNFIENFLEVSRKYDRTVFIKFNSVISKPFDVAEKIFEFCEIKPHQLDSIRLKSKKVINHKGDHMLTAGILNKKIWYSKEDIHKILKADVSKLQRGNLKDADVKFLEDSLDKDINIPFLI